MKSIVESLKDSLVNEASKKKIKQLSFDEFLAELKEFDKNAQDMDFDPVLDGDEFNPNQPINARGVKTVKDFYEFVKKEYGNQYNDSLWDIFNDYLPEV